MLRLRVNVKGGKEHLRVTIKLRHDLDGDPANVLVKTNRISFPGPVADPLK